MKLNNKETATRLAIVGTCFIANTSGHPARVIEAKMTDLGPEITTEYAYMATDARRGFTRTRTGLATDVVKNVKEFTTSDVYADHREKCLESTIDKPVSTNESEILARLEAKQDEILQALSSLEKEITDIKRRLTSRSISLSS